MRLGNSDFCVYRFLLIDVDPIKLTGDAAAEEEVRYATATKDKVVEWLTANGMAPALVTFSGSGYHVLVKVDCWPVADNINFLVKQLLNLLGEKFNDDNVIIDPVTHNVGRRTRVVGVMNRKGEDPSLWRVSRMDAVNPDVKGIQIEELKKVLVANNVKRRASRLQERRQFPRRRPRPLRLRRMARLRDCWRAYRQRWPRVQTPIPLSEFWGRPHTAWYPLLPRLS